ncbi:MAG: DUF2141 domain-containing protein [Myxococcota bacterium]|nr:DUF2141 domain-containing protein [Myxococcota bacterium]
MSCWASLGGSRAVFLSALALALVWATELRGEPEVVPPTGSVLVRVNNLQNVGRGQLLVLVYEEVPRVEINGVKFVRRKVLPVGGERVTVNLSDLPYGDYAVAVLHDMDKDFEADTNLLGIPREDLGVSNNAKGGPLGGPKWSAAKFSHRAKETRLSIKMWRCYR